MADLTKEEFLIHFGYLRDDVAEVKAQLQKLNGRTAKSEDSIGNLKTAVAVLEERSPATKGAAAAWGGGIAGGLVACVELLKAYFAR